MNFQLYDSLNNRLTIKESKQYEYIDYNNSNHINIEKNKEVINLNGIEEVKFVKRRLRYLLGSLLLSILDDNLSYYFM